MCKKWKKKLVKLCVVVVVFLLLSGGCRTFRIVAETPRTGPPDWWSGLDHRLAAYLVMSEELSRFPAYQFRIEPVISDLDFGGC